VQVLERSAFEERAAAARPLYAPKVCGRFSVVRHDLNLRDSLASAGKSVWIPNEFADWRPALPTQLLLPMHRWARARREAHIGELMQGAIALSDWPAHLADHEIVTPDAGMFAVPMLVDLPAPCLFSEATCLIAPGTGQIDMEPAGRMKALEAARLALHVFGVVGQVDLIIQLVSNIRSARGYGASSSDVGATIDAVARALGSQLPVVVIDFLTVVVERASNPSYRGPGIFLQRAGLMPWQWPAWPAMRILGFDSTSADDVVTDNMTRSRYSAEMIRTFGFLLRGLMTAIQQSDVLAVGHAMELSAEINESFLPRRFAGGLAALRETRRNCRAAGFAVSHSGTVAALAWAEDSPDLDDAVGRAERQLRDFGYDVFWHYTLH
jgi:uncharacterized protein involved in propanediol utilization